MFFSKKKFMNYKNLKTVEKRNWDEILYKNSILN